MHTTPFNIRKTTMHFHSSPLCIRHPLNIRKTTMHFHSSPLCTRHLLITGTKSLLIGHTQQFSTIIALSNSTLLLSSATLSHALISCSYLLYLSHALISCTYLMYSSHALISCTYLMHLSHALI